MGEDAYQVMPPLSEEEFAALKASIAEHGVRCPVVNDGEGHIIDGHHRHRAWRQLRDEGYDVPDYPCDVRGDLKTDAEKRELSWSLNMQRRHLSQAQKREMIVKKLKETPEWTNNRIATLVGVSDKTVRALRIDLEIRSEIPNLKKLVGSDGKEYPKHRAADLQNEVEQEGRAEKTVQIRQALQGPTGGRSDAGIAEDFGVSESEVAKQRKSLQEDGPTLREMAEKDPEFARGIAEIGREYSEGMARDHTQFRISQFVNDAKIRKVEPEDVALEVLAEDAGHRAEGAVRGRRVHSLIKRELEYAQEMRDWLERYMTALEEGKRPRLREVKSN